MFQRQKQYLKHRLVEIEHRQIPQVRAFGERSFRFERIGEIHDAIEPRHIAGGRGVFPDGGEHVRILYPKLFPRDRGTEPRVQ